MEQNREILSKLSLLEERFNNIGSQNAKNILKKDSGTFNEIYVRVTQELQEKRREEENPYY